MRNLTLRRLPAQGVRVAAACLLTACAGQDASGKVPGAGAGSPGAQYGDAGSGRGSGWSGAGALGNSTSSASAAPDGCASAELSAQRVIPSVWLLVDGSGSMGTPMDGVQGDPSRWTVLRDALLDQSNGVVAQLQASVSFGLFVYDGGLSPPGIKTDLCPRVVEVAPATNNLAQISAAYPATQMGASTPTHYALLRLRDDIQNAASGAPTYVVLATDGKPNLCDFHDGVPESAATEQQAVATVSELASMGIKTFAISMAEGDAALTAHLNAVAMAGGTGAPVFTPTTSDGLISALSKILEGTMTCDVKLQGKIVAGHECEGQVTMNGKVLACGGQDGFRVKADLQTLELLGAACDELHHDSSATLHANFPCEDVQVY